jgi:AcrR family transcriptional regulator
MVSSNHPSQWPSGRPLIPQEFVYERKRERCAVSLGELVREVGAGGLTVALITRRAQIARSTFYTLFDSQEDAFRYAYGLGNRLLREAVEGATAQPGSRREQVGRALEALVAAAAAEPSLAELCLVHGCGRADPGSGPYDPELVEALIALLEADGAAPAASGRAAGSAELLAHSILSVVARKLRQGDPEALGQLVVQLTEIAV